MPVNTPQDRTAAAAIARAVRDRLIPFKTRREVNLMATQRAYNFLSTVAYMRNSNREAQARADYRKEELRSGFDSKWPGSR